MFCGTAGVSQIGDGQAGRAEWDRRGECHHWREIKKGEIEREGMNGGNMEKKKKKNKKGRREEVGVEDKPIPQYPPSASGPSPSQVQVPSLHCTVYTVCKVT